MSGDHFNEFIDQKFIGLSLVLTFLVWAGFTYMLTPFTFTTHPVWMYVWSGFTAIPIAGTFFFAINMFKLVAAENHKAKSAL